MKNETENLKSEILQIADDMKTHAHATIERLDEMTRTAWEPSTVFVLQIGGPKGNNFLGRKPGRTYASGVHLTGHRHGNVTIQAITGTRERMEKNAARYRECGAEQLGRDMSDLSLEVIDLQTALDRARAYTVYTLTDVIPSIEEKMRSPEDQALRAKFSGGLPQKGGC